MLVINIAFPLLNLKNICGGRKRRLGMNDSSLLFLIITGLPNGLDRFPSRVAAVHLDVAFPYLFAEFPDKRSAGEASFPSPFFETLLRSRY